jgi:hypothetical protein
LVPLTALGGVAWIAFALSNLVAPKSVDGRVELVTTGDHLGFALFAACLALTVPAIAVLHRHHRGADGRLGRAGALVASAGAGAQCVVIATFVVQSAEPSWFGVAAPAAILAWVAGSVVLAVAIRRAAVLPGWVALALPVVTALAVVGANGGSSVLIGAFQLVVALRLVRAEAGGATLAAPPAVTWGARS